MVWNQKGRDAESTGQRAISDSSLPFTYQMASQLLRAALPFAHVHGFTRTALVQASAAGATAAPLSDTALGALFGPRPERALFDEWHATSVQ